MTSSVPGMPKEPNDARLDEKIAQLELTLVELEAAPPRSAGRCRCFVACDHQSAADS
jgi:hypothetical protein